MSAFDYAKTKATADRLLTRFGAAVTITTPAAAVYDPATGETTAPAPSVQTASAVEEAYKLFEIDGTLVRAGDKRLLVSPKTTSGAPLAVPPPGSTVPWSGQTWRVQEAQPFAPAGEVVYLVLQLRKG